MHSRAAACKAAQFILVHQCSHSAMVGQVEDAFVSSEFMCVNRGASQPSERESILGSLRMLRARSGDVGTTCAFVEGTNTIILNLVSTSVLLLAARSVASR